MSLLKKIKKEAKKFFKNAKGSHDWSHVERVYRLCILIGKNEKADLRILKLATLLHDIGRSEQDRLKGKVCHAEKSAELARKILARHRLSDRAIEKIIHCIETHRFRSKKKPRTLEAKVLFDADNLDAIGAVGVARDFLFAGEIGAKLHNSDIDISKTKPYSKEDTAYREYILKLRKIKNRMKTREGKRIAKERHKFMVEFFRRLEREVEGKQ